MIDRCQSRPIAHVAAEAGLHGAVGDRSRLARSEHLPDEKAITAIRFMARAGAFFTSRTITRVVTDDGSCRRAATFIRRS